MNIVFMSMDTLPSTLWARDLYDQMHIRSDFRKWFPRMCQYGFIEGRDYEYMPRVRLQDEGGAHGAAVCERLPHHAGHGKEALQTAPHGSRCGVLSATV